MGRSPPRLPFSAEERPTPLRHKLAVMSLIVAVIALLVLFGWARHGDIEQRRRDEQRLDAIQFSGWTKLHPESKLTIEEWRGLKRGFLLPGQSPPGKDSSGDAFMGGMVGGMVGSQLTK